VKKCLEVHNSYEKSESVLRRVGNEKLIVQYEKALEHHKLAAEKSDVEGKFICYTNLGILCIMLSMWAEAAKNHKVLIPILILLN